MTKTFSFGQALTDQQLNTALAIGDDHAALTAYFKSILPEIEKKLGQEMDPAFLAYAWEYANSVTRRKT